MTFTVTVLNAGTFDATATPPASFVMNALFVPGPQGPTGATGPAGVVAATAPITYNSGTQTVGIDQSGFLLKSGNLAGLADLPSSRLNLGLGSAAVAASGDFAAAVHTHTASQIIDSTTAGRALLTAADAAAQRTSLGLGSMALATAADYLDKAGNLSGLADVAASRGNLGLGTMATETAANYYLASNPAGYVTAATAPVTSVAGKTGAVSLAVADVSGAAPLASPAFTGNPTAPTPSTSDNDTSIATTAFVNAYCPTASTTAAGKVELATDAEAVAGTSATLAVTPKGYTEAIIARNWHIHYAGDFIANTSGTGGTNATIQSSIGRFVYGPTSTGAGHVSASQYHPPRVGGLNNASFNWSKPLWFSFKAARISGTSTNSTFRCIVGAIDTNYGDPVARSIGVRQSGANNAELIVHDGTTLTAVSSSHSFGSTVSEIEIYSDGAGNVTMFANGSSVATTSAGPTTIETLSAYRQVQMQVTNNSSFTSGPLQFLVWMPITKTQD